MKFQRMRDFVMGAVTASLVLGVTPAAFAKVASMNIPVQYNNIKVLVDGEELRTEKEPFIYDGTTYLPMRAVAEAVGKEVSWDSATKTAVLSGGAAELPPEDKEPDEPENKEETQQPSRWIRVTSKTSAKGGSVEVKCTDIRENLEDGRLELDLVFDNTGYGNYDVWISRCLINGKRMATEDNAFAHAYSNRKTRETLEIRLSDLDAAEINSIHDIEITFTGRTIDGGEAFGTDTMRIQFKS